MSEAPPEAQASTEGDQGEQQPKPSETLEFWKQKAREQESRAKANKTAADELAAIKEKNKTEAEKVAERLSKADSELATVPAKVAEALKSHLVSLHQISDEDAELFLTASDPDVLLKQVTRLTARESAGATERKKQGNHVPREGNNPSAPKDERREFVGQLFSGG